MKKPKILITNDDGINAPGIKALWNALKEVAHVTVIAPSKEQSATSLSITLRDPLQIQKTHWENASHIYCVTGTPADCVKLGLGIILKEKPDFVVSGINRGTNAGRNTLYSGTVAGAIEGVLHDIPSIAFSCHDYHEPDYEYAANFVPKVIQHALEHPLPLGTLLNVNFPSKEFGEIKGFKMTRQGKQFWGEDPLERFHPVENHSYYWLGAKLLQFDEIDDCDITWLSKGYATAVPVQVGELTDHNHLAARKNSFEILF